MATKSANPTPKPQTQAPTPVTKVDHRSKAPHSTRVEPTFTQADRAARAQKGK